MAGSGQHLHTRRVAGQVPRTARNASRRCLMSSFACRFDPADPLMPIRVMAGLFYLPHILFKLNGMAGSVAFFEKAGFNPPMLFLILALVAEVVCAIGLTFDILTKWIGLVSAGVMGFALYGILATKGPGWLWNLGGVEYLVFWGVTSLALAAEAWRREARAYGRVFLLFPTTARLPVPAAA